MLKLLLLWSIAYNCYAITFIVGLPTYGNEPLSFKENSKKLGIIKEILAKINIKTNGKFNFLFEYRTDKNIEKSFEKMEIDIEPVTGRQYRQFAKTIGIYTKSFFKQNEILIEKKNTIQTNYKSYIGVITESSPTIYKKFRSARYTKQIFNNYQEAFYALKNNQINMVLTTDAAFEYLTLTNNWQNIFKIKEIITENNLSFRIHPKHTKYIKIFNLLIQKMLNDNTIKEIVNKYL